jgi:hypothetical protein
MQLEENKGSDAPKPEEPEMQPVNEGKTENSAEQASAQGKKEKPAGFKKMPVSKFQKIVNSITLALVCLVIGAMAVLLGLYLPKLSAFNKAEAEVARLTQVEADYKALQADYTKTKEQAGVYKTISDTSLLEVALRVNDPTKANQQLRYVEQDLAAMQIEEFPEILQRLQSQFLKIKTSAAGNPTKALEELGEFYTDLLLLADNLE